MAEQKITLAEEMAQALEAGGRERLAEVAKRVATTRPKKRANLVDLGDEFFTIFGGAPGLARRAYLDYLKAPEGSNLRLGFYNVVVQLAKMAADNGMKSAELLDDDDIEEELLDFFAGTKDRDLGDPKTPEGRDLAKEAMKAVEREMSPEECARIDAEIAQLEGVNVLDEIAARLSEPQEPTDEVE